MERETRVQCRRPRRPSVSQMAAERGGKNGNNGPATAATPTHSIPSARSFVGIKRLQLKNMPENFFGTKGST